MPENPRSAAAGSVAQRVGRAALIVGAGIVLSRILGFVRQIVLSAFIGADGRSDEYFVAFGLPDFLNYLVAGAFLTITFVPIFTKRLTEGDEDAAWEAFTAVFRIIVIAITVLVGVGMLVAEPVVRALQPGFDEAQVLSATRMTRIVLPAQIFLVTGALLMAVQYAKKHFLIPTLAPIVYNLGIIGGGLVGAWIAGGENVSPEGFAWGVLAGSILGNFGIQVFGARRAGGRLVRGVAWWHPAVPTYFKLAVPLMLGLGITKFDEQLGRSFGSLAKDDGAISWLQYARRIMLVPGGIIAQTAGVAAYPYLSQLAEEGKISDLARLTGRALRYVIYLSLAAVAIVFVLAQPIVRALFERGEFTPDDTVATGTVLAIFALAIPLWGTVSIINRGFYARRQMWTVVVIGSLVTVAAVPAYFVLLRLMDYPGLAVASVLGMFAYVFAAGLVWFARTGWDQLRETAVSALRGLVAAAAAAGAAWASHTGLHALHLDDSTFWGAATVCVVSGTAAFLVWVAASYGVRSPEFKDVTRQVRQRLKRRGAT